MQYYLVGEIINTHGIKGELKIQSETDFDRFIPGSILYLLKGKEYIKMTVATHRVHQGFDLVSFISYQDINLVEQFKACKLYVDETQLEELDDDEYYYHDLMNKKVYNQDQKYIGVVCEIRDLPHGEIIEIKREGKKNGLVPFNKEFIKEVTDDSIIINEIEGLL